MLFSFLVLIHFFASFRIAQFHAASDEHWASTIILLDFFKLGMARIPTKCDRNTIVFLQYIVFIYRNHFNALFFGKSIIVKH